MRACGSAGLFVFGLFLVGSAMAGCKESAGGTLNPATTTTTQSADVPRKFLNATECAKPEFKKDERCDWYFDPMRDSELGSSPKDAPAPSGK